MRITFRTFVAISIATVFVRQSAFALISDQKVYESSKKLVEIIEKGREERNILGCVVAIVRHDKVILVKPFGYTSLEKTVPVTTDTVFPISSVSKNVTSFLIGALVDDGKLKLDDKVRKYDKSFFIHSEEFSKNLTIKDLICHGSGFPNFTGDSLWNCGYSKKQTIDAFKYIQQTPGDFRKYYAYQNVFFGLAGDVIEKATGEKYEDLVKKYLFEKMDIKNASAIRMYYEASRWGHIKYMASRFKHDAEKMGLFTAIGNFIKEILTFKPKKVVNGHSYLNGELKETPDIGFFHVYPATSGIAFSGSEFAKWLQMILLKGQYDGKTVVKSDSFQKIVSPVVDVRRIKSTDETFPIERFPREDLHYGLGTFIAKYADNGKNAKNVIFHMGGVRGASAFFAVCPEEDIAVGIINNVGGTTNTLFAEYMCNNFLDLCFDFSKKDWISADANRQQRMGKYKFINLEIFSENPTPAAPLDKYEGVFTSDIYRDIKFSQKNGHLVMDNGIKSVELKHINNNIFACPERAMQACWYDADDYIAFFAEKKSEFNTCKITCFKEGNTLFKRKEH